MNTRSNGSDVHTLTLPRPVFIPIGGKLNLRLPELLEDDDALLCSAKLVVHLEEHNLRTTVSVYRRVKTAKTQPRTPRLYMSAFVWSDRVPGGCDGVFLISGAMYNVVPTSNMELSAAYNGKHGETTTYLA